jgi:penicillin-binding protein 1A
VVPEEKIAELNSMMKEVVKSGTARNADLGFAPQAGKTGTNQSYRDAWFIGFTAHHVTGVWVGNDDFSAMNKVTGGLVPAIMWKNIMLVAESGMTPEGLPGIPLDASYTKVADAQPAAPVTPAVAAAAAADETGQAVTDSATQVSPDSTDVLNSLVSLFDSPAPQTQQAVQAQQASPAPRPAARVSGPVKAKKRALIAPNRNRASVSPSQGSKRSVFDMIFGLNPAANPPPRKRRPLNIFGF